MIFGATSVEGDVIDGVFEAFGVALALPLCAGLVFGVSVGAVGVLAAAIGVRLGLLALRGGNVDARDFSKNGKSSHYELHEGSLTEKHLPSLLTPETPVPAMLTGRALRTGVDLLLTIAEFVVDVDIALPGRDVDTLFGVISPERSPTKLCQKRY
jgi:hypothetical protein